MKAPVDVAEVKPFEMVISASPTELATGVVKVRLESDMTFTPTVVFPNFRLLSPIKPVPDIVTKVPPSADPLLGVTEVMVGAGGAV